MPACCLSARLVTRKLETTFGMATPGVCPDLRCRSPALTKVFFHLKQGTSSLISTLLQENMIYRKKGAALPLPPKRGSSSLQKSWGREGCAGFLPAQKRWDTEGDGGCCYCLSWDHRTLRLEKTSNILKPISHQIFFHLKAGSSSFTFTVLQKNLVSKKSVFASALP